MVFIVLQDGVWEVLKWKITGSIRDSVLCLSVALPRVPHTDSPYKVPRSHSKVSWAENYSAVSITFMILYQVDKSMFVVNDTLPGGGGGCMWQMLLVILYHINRINESLVAMGFMTEVGGKH